ALRPGDTPVTRVEVPAHVGVRHRQEAYAQVVSDVTEDFQVDAGLFCVACRQGRVGRRYAHAQHSRFPHELEGRVRRQDVHESEEGQEQDGADDVLPVACELTHQDLRNSRNAQKKITTANAPRMSGPQAGLNWLKWMKAPRRAATAYGTGLN